MSVYIGQKDGYNNVGKIKQDAPVYKCRIDMYRYYVHIVY